MTISKLAGGTGEVPDLTRVGDHERQLSCCERCHCRTLVATGRLEHDERRGVSAHALDERLDARRIIGHRPAFP